MINNEGSDIAMSGRMRNVVHVLFIALALNCAAYAAPQSQEPQKPAEQRQKPATGATRTEKDLLGEKEVPADAYYGVQTVRALENFQISGIPINHYPEFVEAWAIVKLAAARANTDVGAMNQREARRDREGGAGGSQRRSTTISSWSTGTRAAPARRPT